jgi:hypothetical protein
MISVKLAKKLRAAGFREVVLYEESRTVIAPTLSELMDACPNVLDGGLRTMMMAAARLAQKDTAILTTKRSRIYGSNSIGND